MEFYGAYQVLLEDRLPLCYTYYKVESPVACDNLFASIAHTPFLPKDRMEAYKSE
jgi:hypothetical protein